MNKLEIIKKNRQRKNKAPHLTQESSTSKATTQFDVLKIYASIISSSIAISVIAGAFFAVTQCNLYGIDFIQLAEIDDYIRIGVSNILTVTVLLISLGILLVVAVTILDRFIFRRTNKYQLINYLPLYKSLPPVHRVTLSVTASIFLVLTLMPVGDEPMISEAPPDVDIKNKLVLERGLVTVYHSKDYRPESCLVYIAQTGDYFHYWSVKNRKRYSYNTASIVVIEEQFSRYEPKHYYSRSYGEAMMLEPKVRYELSLNLTSLEPVIMGEGAALESQRKDPINLSWIQLIERDCGTL
ncbi:hypothetical protein Q4574_14665 [Aliiglaciecola sp. 3_MG-2023]|uniref:hypothetical protein n=1 Tax=Aliiglaciecola sp. 3_MG-2023 TaxID=3062644 RepID=UPI0026E45C50|nr:hypothetical protein [Aliiglaciecola sp. 3_MG-2023]MDO6694536.1 hypothetical protein [Aliiglaciecola sp. 3_MG-2023]